MLDGWIGLELLVQHAVQLDFTAKRMTLITPGNVAGTDFVAKNSVRIPFVLTDQGYTLQMLVDGKQTPFVLDLLSNTTVLNSKAFVATLKPQSVSEDIGKDGRTRFLRLHSLAVGNMLWTDPIALDFSAPDNSQPNYLGTDFLKRFHATIDFAGQALYLEPDADYKEDPTEHNGVGIVPTITADGRIFVSALSDPSSAKESNIQLDDEILEVNGLIVKNTPTGLIAAEFKKPIGTEVMVLIQHKGDAAPRTVKLIVRKVL